MASGRPLDTVDLLVAALGGTQAVIQLTGVTRSAISNWRKRKAIPPRLYLNLCKAIERRGFEVDPLLFRQVSDQSQNRETAAR